MFNSLRWMLLFCLIIPDLQASSSPATYDGLPRPSKTQNWLTRRPWKAIVPNAQTITKRLEEAIDEQVKAKNIPAMSIALIDDQKIVWAKGFGMADPATGRKADAHTVYRVGSVSKLFTALAVMKLVEQGKLDLDAPLQNYLPDFRPQNDFQKATTLRQILSHRSGLVREPPVGSYFDGNEPSLAKMVSSLNSTKIVYQPESKTKYSNAAVSVAGYAVGQTVNRPFSQYVQQTLLTPLGMESSSFVRSEKVRSLLSKAEMWTFDGRVSEAPPFLLGTGPAGNLYSNVTDLGKFVSFLFAGGVAAGGPEGQANGKQVIAEKTLKRMWQVQFASKSSGGPKSGFGLGFYVSTFKGHQRVGHNGAVYGFSTSLAALPDRKLGVVAAAAKDVCNGTVSRITEYALELMLAKKPDDVPPLKLAEPLGRERAQQLQGRYADKDGGVLELERRDNTLILSTWDANQRQVKIQGDQLVLDDEFGYGPTIKRLTSGDLEIGGKVWRRQKDQPPPAAPSKWQGLIGEYGPDHNVLYILERHGKLIALIEWFFYYPLTEINKNEFAFPNFGMYHGEKLIFQRDASGRAVKVVAASVPFERRRVGPEDGETFHIKPLKPIEDLRRTALAATPPREEGEFRKPRLVDIASLDSTIKLDIRYATTNNFMQHKFYRKPRAFLQQPAAEALLAAHRSLKRHGYGLLIFDAYRPWYVTKMFYDATPKSMKKFVADPSRGSRHNRGAAVDLSLFELSTGKPAPMVAGYDEFSPRSYPYYPGGQTIQRWRRRLLRQTMESAGFAVYEYEWWHFDYRDWKKYPISNAQFEELEGE